jgi:hypothetical protein
MHRVSLRLYSRDQLFGHSGQRCFVHSYSLLGLYLLATLSRSLPSLGQPIFYSSLGLEQDPAAPGCSYTNDFIGESNGIFFGTGFFGCLAGWAGNRFGRVDGFRIAATTEGCLRGFWASDNSVTGRYR